MSNSALAIVPCYNEAESIAEVIHAIRHWSPECDVLVVSDGSTDESAAVARQHGATVVELPCNLGIGGAMQTGFQYADRNGYSYVIQVDGDGQHPAREISSLLQVVRDGTADLAVGSRYLDVGRVRGRVSSWGRVAGGTLLSFWLSFLGGEEITDPTSGFRAMNRRVFSLFAREYPKDYPEPVSLVVLLRKSYTISELGVRMKERTQGSSSIKSIHAGIYMCKVMWRMALERVFR